MSGSKASVTDTTTTSNDDDDDDDDFDDDYIDVDDDDDDNDNDNNDDDDDAFEFDDDDSEDGPTMTVKVSDELYKIVFCSRYEGMCALYRLNELKFVAEVAEETELETEFFNSFHTNDGSVKVFDFLKATMNDSNCEIQTRTECISFVGQIIKNIYCQDEDDSNKKIVTKIITSAVDCGGIDTLINASKECSGGDDKFYALASVCVALSTITNEEKIVEDKIGKHQAIILFDACINILSQLDLYDVNSSGTLRNLFHILRTLIRYKKVEKTHFRDTNVLSKCLDVFKKDETWGDRSEAVTELAISFFHMCHQENLLDRGDDYEMLLPFLVIGLKKFSSNVSIQGSVVWLVYGACDTIDNRRIIEKSGVIEPLAALLLLRESDVVFEQFKMNVRKLIVTITTP